MIVCNAKGRKKYTISLSGIWNSVENFSEETNLWFNYFPKMSEQDENKNKMGKSTHWKMVKYIN